MAEYGKEVTTQAESDEKYVQRGGEYVCRSCGSHVMAVDEIRTVPIHEFPNSCAGFGNVDTVKIQHPYCSGCEKQLGDSMVEKYRR